MSYNGLVYHKQGSNELVVASGGQITVESGGIISAASGSIINNNGGCVDASIVVGAEASDVRTITIQLKDAAGADMAVRTAVTIAVLLDANGDAFVVTGGSTGIAIGTDGALHTITAKKLFLAISEADGDIDLTWTDTGTEAAYLAVILPNGKMIISTALTNT
jgi:hypothetical protein